jgi:hypothetical protein
MFEARLAEALGCHVEVLNFELLDALSKDSIHLPHVDQLIVHFVDVSSFVVISGSWFSLVQTAEPSMFSIAHRNLRLDFLRKHAFKVTRVCFENPLNKLQAFS